ncbi:NUDIX hydrolase [Geofilum rubicundum]|uniref:Nudix-like regulator n=1 Tax=Geofilum rubicundum JCM 15548 TaxID=1236989 RepID=A0A0E9LWZ1_9BACT|nr:NUDIX domain-containing protein [Geofilum rubicundum]GAO29774.1 Nudix-like regulator [Geofilum rubicundum JCM 15548]
MVYHHPKLLVAVDCVIFGYEDGELKLLLRPREIEPALGKWSLMGGFVGLEESVEDAAMRVLYSTTGLKDIYLEQVAAFSAVDRDPGARVVSIAFVALIRIDQHDKALVRENGAHWWPLNQLPELIFDHEKIINDGLRSLQKRASFELTGKELLPEKFTLMQLRSLYEVIYQRPFDPGNFRKKVLSLNVLERLNIKNTTESKKGAFYYRFKESEDNSNGDRIFKIN